MLYIDICLLNTFNGMFVGLISAAETRMAGYFIAFARLLWVKNVLKSVINLHEYVNMCEKNLFV